MKINNHMKSQTKIILISMLILTILILHLIDLKPMFLTSPFSEKIKGIDISHHNTIQNWDKVKTQVDFCIIKSTEGATYKDPMFNKNWVSTKRNNVIRGAYHFFSPNVPAEKQFQNFKNSVKLVSGDFPPVVDVELKEVDMNEVNKFLKLAEKYYGVKPIVYTEHIFFKVFMEGKIDNSYPLWIYIDQMFVFKPSFKNYNCVLWQYSHTGKIDGIKGDVDLDLFMGGSDKLKSLLIK